MSFFVDSAGRRPAPPFGISMLGAAEPPLRRGFAWGKTLVRRTRAAGQKGRWVVFLQRFCSSKISILTVPSTKKASAKQMPFLWITPPISALRAAAERRLRAQRAGVLAWGANACAVRGGERAAQCPDVAFRPRIPTRSRAAKKSRAGAAGSLNRMMPAIRAPRAPIPVQMA